MLPVLLCVDDRPELLQIRKSALEPFGFSVVTADGATRAISVLERMTVAAVILDYKLEGMDAEAIAFHIKTRFPGQTVILLSAYSEMPERILWLVDDFVLKSEPAERLVHLINQVTSAKKPVQSATLIPKSEPDMRTPSTGWASSRSSPVPRYISGR